MRRLVRNEAAILDWRERGLLAAFLDGVTNADGIVPLVVLGSVRPHLGPDLAGELLDAAETRGRALGIRGIEIAANALWQGSEGELAARAWRRDYIDLDMICHDPAWGPDGDLPPGYLWRDVLPDGVEDYCRLIHAGFAGMAGAFLPDRAEIENYLRDPDIAARLLSAGPGQAIALLRYTPSEAYINAVVRHPDWRGAGLGRLVLDEARRHMAEKPMRLSVVDRNLPAVRLYRSCGFEIEKSVPAYRREFA